MPVVSDCMVMLSLSVSFSMIQVWTGILNSWESWKKVWLSVLNVFLFILLLWMSLTLNLDGGLFILKN